MTADPIVLSPAAVDELRPPLSLSPLQADVLLSIYQHRLLTASQVRRMHLPHAGRRRVQHVLATLERRGYTTRVTRPTWSHEACWLVTPAGIAASEAGEVRSRLYRITPELAAGPLQDHTLRVNDVGLVFLETARRHGHGFGPLDWHHELGHPVSDRTPAGRDREMVVPDAVVQYSLPAAGDGPDQPHTWLVELDRARMNVEALTAKLRRYVQLFEYVPAAAAGRAGSRPAWRGYYASFPAVLVVFADKPEPVLMRRMATLAGRCQADPTLSRAARDVHIGITTLTLLQQHGPLSPIFWRPFGGGEPVDVFGRPAGPTG